MSGEHTHDTGGAWHVTRWAVPGCPACTPNPEPSEVAETTAGEREVSGLRSCEGCGAELDADDRNRRCDECTPAEPDAGEVALTDVIGLSLYESLMEASADHWRRWEFLTDAAKETYRAEAARIVATAISPWLAAHVSAAETKARAEALREFADTRGVNVGDEDDEWWRGYRQAQRECLHDAVARAASIARGDAR